MTHDHHHHGHGHGHEHGGGGGGNSAGEHNKAHFDDIASKLEGVEWIQAIARQVTNELQSNLEWIGIQPASKGKLLDYACGTGVVSRALAPHMETVLGVDISAGMLKEFARLAEAAGFSSDRMRAVHGDLLNPHGTPAPELDTPEAWGFDLAVMSLALHHVQDAQMMLARLVERLRPGGTLLIIDLVGKERSELPATEDVRHGGFTEEQIYEWFTEAGLERWAWKLFTDPIEIPAEHGGEKTTFMARGVKAAARDREL